jgi:hypothetical protein
MPRYHFPNSMLKAADRSFQPALVREDIQHAARDKISHESDSDSELQAAKKARHVKSQVNWDSDTKKTELCRIVMSQQAYKKTAQAKEVKWNLVKDALAGICNMYLYFCSC